jgi:hypothetical protein
MYVEKVSYQRDINKVAEKQQQYLLKFNFSSMLRLRPDKLFLTLSLAWDCRLACGTKDEQPLVDSLLSERSSPLNRRVHTHTHSTTQLQTVGQIQNLYHS